MWIACVSSRRVAASVHPISFAPSDDDALPREAYRIDDLKSTERLPRSIFCPIAHVPMQDPVVASDGFSYERRALAQWLATHNTSPITNRKMPNTVLPNHSLRNTIAELVGGVAPP